MSPLYLSLQHTDFVLGCDISLAIQREAGDMSLRGWGARRLDSREGEQAENFAFGDKFLFHNLTFLI